MPANMPETLPESKPVTAAWGRVRAFAQLWMGNPRQRRARHAAGGASARRPRRETRKRDSSLRAAMGTEVCQRWGESVRMKRMP